MLASDTCRRHRAGDVCGTWMCFASFGFLGLTVYRGLVQGISEFSGVFRGWGDSDWEGVLEVLDLGGVFSLYFGFMEVVFFGCA